MRFGFVVAIAEVEIEGGGAEKRETGKAGTGALESNIDV
jgi:hypothetical protein